MQLCFKSITALPLSHGDMIEQFQRDLNPHLKRPVAIVGMGNNGT